MNLRKNFSKLIQEHPRNSNPNTQIKEKTTYVV